MGKLTGRTSCTSKGFIALAPWFGDYSIYEHSVLNLGTNPNSRLEVVSLINILNISSHLYSYDYNNRAAHFNPKVYMSTVQTSSINWIFDRQNGQTNGLPNLVPGGYEKSGSIIKNIKLHKINM